MSTTNEARQTLAGLRQDLTRLEAKGGISKAEAGELRGRIDRCDAEFLAIDKLSAQQKAIVENAAHDATMAERKRLCAIGDICLAAGVSPTRFYDTNLTADQVASDREVMAGKRYRAEFAANAELRSRMSEADYVASRRVDDGFSRLGVWLSSENEVREAIRAKADARDDVLSGGCPRPPACGDEKEPFGIGSDPISGQ